jgi:hypothetical protein
MINLILEQDLVLNRAGPTARRVRPTPRAPFHKAQNIFFNKAKKKKKKIAYKFKALNMLKKKTIYII